jgi:nuclear transport factor 2 (NTF2) superfamily protein
MFPKLLTLSLSKYQFHSDPGKFSQNIPDELHMYFEKGLHMKRAIVSEKIKNLNRRQHKPFGSRREHSAT